MYIHTYHQAAFQRAESGVKTRRREDAKTVNSAFYCKVLRSLLEDYCRVFSTLFSLFFFLRFFSTVFFYPRREFDRLYLAMRLNFSRSCARRHPLNYFGFLLFDFTFIETDALRSISRWKRKAFHRLPPVGLWKLAALINDTCAQFREICLAPIVQSSMNEV